MKRTIMMPTPRERPMTIFMVGVTGMWMAYTSMKMIERSVKNTRVKTRDTFLIGMTFLFYLFIK